MLDQEYLDKLIAWQKEGRRHIKIEIGTSWDSKDFSIWAYDYDLMKGEALANGNMPDIPGKIQREELAELEKLQAKYGKAA